MNGEQFIRQLQSQGAAVHKHGGVWWRQHAPFYWRPAVPFTQLRPGQARPSPLRALVGYSHLVPEGADSNSTRHSMVYERPMVARFALESIISKKRNQVRKGFRCCEIRRIADIDMHWEDLRQINISARERTGVGLPGSYYVDHYDRWRSTIRGLFSLPDRDWWGAFAGSRLIAYYFAYAVEGTFIIDTAKTHSDFLAQNPTDALLFTLMEDALNVKGCRRIIYGDWTPNDEKLTRFKEQHGFVVKAFPSYNHFTIPAGILLRLRGSSRVPSTRWGS